MTRKTARRRRTSPPPPSDSTLSGFAPVDLTPDRGGWKRKKAAIRDRLLRARAEGVTFPELEQAGIVTFEEMAAIVNAAKVDMSVYRRVEAALDALGK